MVVFLENQNNLIKKCKVGFSWTFLFFGCLVPLFRGDVKWTLLSLLFSIISFNFSNIIIAFIYNKIYIIKLIEKGYVCKDEYSKTILMEKNIISK